GRPRSRPWRKLAPEKETRFGASGSWLDFGQALEQQSGRAFRDVETKIHFRALLLDFRYVGGEDEIRSGNDQPASGLILKSAGKLFCLCFVRREGQEMRLGRRGEIHFQSEQITERQ